MAIKYFIRFNFIACKIMFGKVLPFDYAYVTVSFLLGAQSVVISSASSYA